MDSATCATDLCHLPAVGYQLSETSARSCGRSVRCLICQSASYICSSCDKVWLCSKISGSAFLLSSSSSLNSARKSLYCSMAASTWPWLWRVIAAEAHDRCQLAEGPLALVDDPSEPPHVVLHYRRNVQPPPIPCGRGEGSAAVWSPSMSHHQQHVKPRHQQHATRCQQQAAPLVVHQQCECDTNNNMVTPTNNMVTPTNNVMTPTTTR